MNVLSELEGMGVFVSLSDDEHLILDGLKNLNQEQREHALSLVKTNKADIVKLLTWWQPWPRLSGELPIIFADKRGFASHRYRDGLTRFVGMCATPSVPESGLPAWRERLRTLASQGASP